MNDDLISRNDVLEIIMQYCADDDGSCAKPNADLREMLDEVENIPSVDAEPVRRGRWEWKDGAAYCTAHKGKLSPHVYGYAHCPWCGARMEGV